MPSGGINGEGFIESKFSLQVHMEMRPHTKAKLPVAVLRNFGQPKLDHETIVHYAGFIAWGPTAHGAILAERPIDKAPAREARQPDKGNIPILPVTKLHSAGWVARP